MISDILTAIAQFRISRQTNSRRRCFHYVSMIKSTNFVFVNRILSTSYTSILLAIQISSKTFSLLQMWCDTSNSKIQLFFNFNFKFRMRFEYALLFSMTLWTNCLTSFRLFFLKLPFYKGRRPPSSLQFFIDGLCRPKFFAKSRLQDFFQGFPVTVRRPRFDRWFL